MNSATVGTFNGLRHVAALPKAIMNSNEAIIIVISKALLKRVH